MKRQPKFVKQDWKHTQRKKARNLHWLPSPASCLMWNLGMMRLTWRNWKKVYVVYRWMVSCGELVSMLTINKKGQSSCVVLSQLDFHPMYFVVVYFSWVVHLPSISFGFGSCQWNFNMLWVVCFTILNSFWDDIFNFIQPSSFNTTRN